MTLGGCFIEALPVPGRLQQRGFEVHRSVPNGMLEMEEAIRTSSLSTQELGFALAKYYDRRKMLQNFTGQRARPSRKAAICLEAATELRYPMLL